MAEGEPYDLKEIPHFIDESPFGLFLSIPAEILLERPQYQRNFTNF
jgi:hypothetical protein